MSGSDEECFSIQYSLDNVQNIYYMDYVQTLKMAFLMLILPEDAHFTGLSVW